VPAHLVESAIAETGNDNSLRRSCGLNGIQNGRLSACILDINIEIGRREFCEHNIQGRYRKAAAICGHEVMQLMQREVRDLFCASRETEE